MPGPQDVRDFEGIWAVKRQIRDNMHSRCIFGEGKAQFHWESGQNLVLDETLSLKSNDGPVINGTQRYFWEQCDSGIDVFFSDRRPFHHIDLTALSFEVTHHCDPDLYIGAYHFENWPFWRVEWRVEGPRKDYHMVTEYSNHSGANC